jgi:hypothetical protein
MDDGAAVLDSRWIWPPVVHKALAHDTPFCQVIICVVGQQCAADQRDPIPSSADTEIHWAPSPRVTGSGSTGLVARLRSALDSTNCDLHLHMHLLPTASRRPRVDASGVAKLDLARLDERTSRVQVYLSRRKVGSPPDPTRLELGLDLVFSLV